MAIDEYKIQSTSANSAIVESIVLGSTSTTRTVLNAKQVNNPQNPDACVELSLLHQRKGIGGAWEALLAESLSKLPARETARFSLDTAKTLNLVRHLTRLYEAKKQAGLPRGEKTLVVGSKDEVVRTPADRLGLLQELAQSPGEFWKVLEGAHPELVRKLAYAKLHEERAAALADFKAHLEVDEPENWWQSFFQRNTWIFGYGLDYRFLKLIQARPNYGGTSLTGRGGHLGDFLGVSEATRKFTVLIEIKRPESSLLHASEYRNGAYVPAEDVSGGVAQVQAACHEWENSAKDENNRERLKEVLTIYPKGILVVGHLKQLTDFARVKSFELFRRNTVNPEILTFDEVEQRASFIVEHTESE